MMDCLCGGLHPGVKGYAAIMQIWRRSLHQILGWCVTDNPRFKQPVRNSCAWLIIKPFSIPLTVFRSYLLIVTNWSKSELTLLERLTDDMSWRDSIRTGFFYCTATAIWWPMAIFSSVTSATTKSAPPIASKSFFVNTPQLMPSLRLIDWFNKSTLFTEPFPGGLMPQLINSIVDFL